MLWYVNVYNNTVQGRSWQLVGQRLLGKLYWGKMKEGGKEEEETGKSCLPLQRTAAKRVKVGRVCLLKEPLHLCTEPRCCLPFAEVAHLARSPRSRLVWITTPGAL